MTDYHNHCLPQMDDGSESPAETAAMLELLRRQGFRRVVATPHYVFHREPVASFLTRRSQAMAALTADEPTRIPEDLTLVPGAEVRLERGLSEQDSLDLLAMGASRLILLELPFGPFQSWMPDEILNIAYRFQLTPVLAHIDRYCRWYSSEEMARVLAVEDAVVQINCDALLDRKTLKFVRGLIRQNRPLVFGTDAHNMGPRVPNGNLPGDILKKKLSPSEWDALIHRNRTLLPPSPAADS